MKLEYFTKLPIVELVFDEAKVKGIRTGGNVYLRASDIVAIEERVPVQGEGITYTSVLTNAISHGETHLTSLSAQEVVTEIARANDAVKADAENEMQEMMARMGSPAERGDTLFGDTN